MSAARALSVGAWATRAEWLAEWTSGNRGLCGLCNAAEPTAAPFTCPSGCDLEPAYLAGRRWLTTPRPEMERARRSALPRVYTLRELLDDPAMTTPPPMLVPGLVMQRGVTLLSGPAKAGKSTFASQIAADFSAGRATYDGSELTPGRVLWVSVDEPPYMLLPRLGRMGADLDRCSIVFRDPDAPLTAEALAGVLNECRPGLVVIDTLSQLAINAGVKMNEAESVGVFMRALVDAIQSQPCCGALLLYHTPHHSPRAFGSVQWGAIVDAPLVFDRPRRAVRPGESPEEDAADQPEDGRRVVSGVTRWAGAQRLVLSYQGGRYGLGSAEVPLIDRVRWYLTNTDPGIGRTSNTAMAAALKVRDQSVTEVVRELDARGEVKRITEGGKSFLRPTASMLMYTGSGADRVGVAGEGVREGVVVATSSRDETPMSARGKRWQPAGSELEDGYLASLFGDESAVQAEDADVYE